MKKMKLILAGLLLVPFVALATTPVSAQSDFNLRSGASSAQGKGTAGEITDPSSTVTNVVNIILWFVGILSVIMIIFGGIKYATSAGDSGKVTSAKNTIMYAVIGLIVAIFAYAIVNFVISGGNNSLFTPGTT